MHEFYASFYLNLVLNALEREKEAATKENLAKTNYLPQAQKNPDI